MSIDEKALHAAIQPTDFAASEKQPGGQAWLRAFLENYEAARAPIAEQPHRLRVALVNLVEACKRSLPTGEETHPDSELAKAIKALAAQPVTEQPVELADNYLAALLDYTCGFYAAAIEHGMRAATAAEAVKHIESAARFLHALTNSPKRESSQPDDCRALFEEKASKNGFVTARSGDGYFNDALQWCWMFWCLALKQVPKRESGGDFTTLRQANTERQKEWDEGNQITLSYRGNELAGEVGELCNVLKKLEREKMGIRGSRASVEQAEEEAADGVICIDLICADLGIDLWAAVRRKFNKTSDKNGLTTHIEGGSASD
jgi:NTP pyrophosphatase (non-canonical NTP hydrolase)